LGEKEFEMYIYEQLLYHVIITLKPFGRLTIEKVCDFALIWKIEGEVTSQEFCVTFEVPHNNPAVCIILLVIFACHPLIPHCII
jgi:hypothetical protein